MNFIQQMKYLSAIKIILGNFGSKKGKFLGSKYAVLKRLASFVNVLPTDKIEEFSDIVLKNHNLRDVLNLGFSKREVYIDVCMEQDVPVSFILGVFYNFYQSNIQLFMEFEEKRKLLERYFLLDENVKALNLLNEIDDNFGESIWSLDCRLALAKKIEPDNDLSAYKSNRSPRLSHISFLLIQKQNAKSPLAFQQQVTNHSFSEMRKGTKRKYADFLSILLLNSDLDANVDYRLALIFTQRLYPIDKLVFISKIISELCSNNFQSFEHASDIKDFVSKMSKTSNDERWLNMYNLIEGKSVERLNEKYARIINLYSIGQYEETIDECEKFYLEYPEQLSLIDIHAKSIYFINTKKKSVLIKDKDKFRDILIDNLVKIYTNPKNYESGINVAEDIKFRLSCFECINTILPAFYSSFPFINQDKLIKACCLLASSYFFITPKYKVKLKSDDLGVYNFELDDTSIELSQGRALRYKLEYILRKNKELDKDYVFQLLDQVEKTKEITVPELSQLKSITLIKTEEYEKLLTIINKSCQDNPEDIILYPISYLSNMIDNGDLNIDNSLELSFFSFIIFQYFDKEFKDIVGEFVEDYLEVHSCNRPSEMLEQIEDISKKQIYFFEKVCCQSILSSMRKITLTQTMLLERIKIINQLLTKFRYTNPTIEKEEKDIYQSLLLSKLSSSHETNKITIDRMGLFEHRKNEYEHILQTLVMLKSFGQDSIKDFILQVDEEQIETESKDISVEEKPNAILHFYGVIYSQFIADFIMNEEYGLVRYLSSEIRHGVMPNQMRSVFEAEHLITEIDSTGKYKENTHWINKYEQELTTYDKIALSNILNKFSLDVDTLINKTNLWTKPLTATPVNAISKNSIDSAFIFLIDDEHIKLFSEVIEHSLSVVFPTDINDEHVLHFFCTVEEYIWKNLDDCFIIIKRMLNEILKTDFNVLCEELKNKIERQLSHLELKELIETITRSRNNIIEKINHIERWFRRPIEEVEENVSLYDTVNTAIYCLRGIYEPADINVEITTLDFSNPLLNNKQLLSLTRSIVTMVMNCLKHGSEGKETVVNILLESKGNEHSITVINAITVDTLNFLISKKIDQEVKTFPSCNDTKKLVTEGGTGLYKAFRNIMDGFENFSFNVEFGSGKFKQIIKLSVED
ncbi:hypothetical protein RX418_001495 [Citrobacter freundii]|nr:hypothetical protein [Citrobacter freundii]